MKKGKGCDREKEEKKCMMASGRTWKCHEREREKSRDLERSDGEKGSGHPIAKAALNIVSSPEGCDIFLQSLLAVLISLHMSWMKIEFVWKRGRYYWLYHCLLIMCACVRVCVCDGSRVSVCVYLSVRASIVRTRANQFITASDCVSPIYHCQCSSPLQCQLI